MKRTSVIIVCLMLVGVRSNTFAQMYHGLQVSSVSLHSGVVKTGKPFTLGIKISMEPGWHTYWKTPGDAGAPPTAELVDAPDYRISELRFPTPHKRVAEDIVSYVYEDEVVYLLQVRPHSPSASHRFKLHLRWLICKDVCLPADTILEFNIDSLTKTQTDDDQKLLDRWTAKLPQPGIGFNLDRAGAVMHPLSGNKKSIFIKFYDIAPNTIVDFFPFDEDGIAIDYNSIAAVRDGISMTIEPSNASAILTHIAGVALIGTTGYEVDIPVSKQ